MLDLKQVISMELNGIYTKLCNIRMEYRCTPPSDRKDEYVLALTGMLREHAADLFAFACQQEMRGNLGLMEKGRCQQWYRDIRFLAAETIREIGRPDLDDGTGGYDVILEHH